jgi:hypothetical protein
MTFIAKGGETVREDKPKRKRESGHDFQGSEIRTNNYLNDK